jgi:RNA polymerase sigma-70 factor (ECF subfamily)
MTGDAARPAADLTRDGFGTTVWSLVLAAGRAEDSGQALERLCRKHWRPIYVFIRGSGFKAADAEDATQDFFYYLLRKEWIKQADPARGSFRAYLLALLRNFLANYRRSERTLKRGGATETLSFAAADAERELSALAADNPDPARAYEAAWARSLLQTALARLADEQAAAGKADVFNILRPFVLQSPAPGDYPRLAQTLELKRGQVALLIHRLSRRFAELIRIEVGETLADRAELDAELRHLLAVSA